MTSVVVGFHRSQAEGLGTHLKGGSFASGERSANEVGPGRVSANASFPPTGFPPTGSVR